MTRSSLILFTSLVAFCWLFAAAGIEHPGQKSPGSFDAAMGGH
ncbi:MAG: hypothetical protein AB8E87_12495 [Prochlorococcus sp.]